MSIIAEAEARDSEGSARPSVPRGTPVARAATFLATAGLVVAYALPGGSYDIVTRQSYGAVIWTVLAFGIALRLLPRARPSRGALVVLGLAIAYTAWVGISLAWTESAERTTAELARDLGYVGLLALVGSLLDRRVWRSAAAGIALGAIVVCGLSVASRLAPSAFPPNVVGHVFATDRLAYPFGYWNAVAAWGAMSAAIALGWSVHDDRLPARALALAAVPLATTMTYLTYSRAGIGGIVLGLVTVLLLSRHRMTAIVHATVAAFGTAITVAVIRGHSEIAHATGSAGAASVLAVLLFACAAGAVGAWVTALGQLDSRRIPRRIGRPVGAVCVAALLMAAGAAGPRIVSHAWHQFRHQGNPPTNANPTQRLTTLAGNRYGLWVVSLHAFEAEPLSGTGAGTYEFWWNRHQRDSGFVRNAHSIWLENMGEIGLPGLLAIVGFIGSAVVLLAHRRRRTRRRASAAASTAMLAGFLVFLLHASVDWMWQSTAVTVLALMALATVASRGFRGQPALPGWGRAGLALLASAAALFQLPGLLSTRDLRQSQTAQAQGSHVLAAAWARQAVSAEPWAASPHEQLGLVLESTGQLGAAARELRRAISRERTNFTHWLILARIETELGRPALGLQDYDRAHALRTMSGFFYAAPR